MEVTALRIKLLMIVMILLCDHDQEANAASLCIDPNRAQFFEYQSVTLYCDDVAYCEVVRESNGKKNISHSSCTIKTLYAADSGEYRCSGLKMSNSVNITVTAGSVILEIPALSVMEGEAVTLRCRNKTTSSQTSAHFYKDGVFIDYSFTGKMSISSVSKSDEGLYKCSISGAGESAESWLSVRDDNRCPTPDFTPWIIVTVSLACLLLVVGLLHFVKCYWRKEASARGAFCSNNKEPSTSVPFTDTDSPSTEDMFYTTIP